MAIARVNGVNLYYELHGAGDPVALVHGSWADTTSWGQVLEGLAESFQVLVYDRRGHSQSERPETQGSWDEDGDDLVGLLEALDLAPAHVVTNSAGGNIALRLAIREPRVFRSLTCHEPPLMDLLEDDPESQAMLSQTSRSLESVGRSIAAGDHAGAARQFVEEVAFGPGTWDTQFPPPVKEMFIRNAPTFLDEIKDPNEYSIDKGALGGLAMPVRLTQGSESPPIFPRIIDQLESLIPQVTRETIEGAAHVPHLTTPGPYIEVTKRAVQLAGGSSPTTTPTL
ncbi:alpha/beta fold hydrolase [Arthrobacter sp. ISL-5]|uniref:alpha/beta fold hydrolase n=1 Tax=Arthrobacter sp. ISL-5 TaxID=2819111 RepID=UPI001BE9D36F|nr:alpha/beta hydrolase [Arthrobacter sp. ISL-5]MBT2556151.1 alpha/beta hydrolase [Arthrobacter sp. ISL-5]